MDYRNFAVVNRKKLNHIRGYISQSIRPQTPTLNIDSQTNNFKNGVLQKPWNYSSVIIVTTEMLDIILKYFTL